MFDNRTLLYRKFNSIVKLCFIVDLVRFVINVLFWYVRHKIVTFFFSITFLVLINNSNFAHLFFLIHHSLCQISKSSFFDEIYSHLWNCFLAVLCILSLHRKKLYRYDKSKKMRWIYLSKLFLCINVFRNIESYLQKISNSITSSWK